MADSPSPTPTVPPPLAPCPECGGTCVPARFEPFMRVQRQEAIVSGFSDRKAVVCVACGYTRLYALRPQVLLEQRCT
jgi:hypothetical protein